MGGESRVHKSSLLADLNVRNLSIIGLTAIVLALPMLIHGPMQQGHDTYEHLNYSRYFSEQFWHGEWYPRWLIGMNHGLGSPTLFVYPPLPSYVYAFLLPVAKVVHCDAFRMGELLVLFGSGVCAWLWLKTITTDRIALACALLYMLMPYHLAIDYYRRTALSECWALVWMPLVLYCCVKVRERPAFLVGIAFAYAMLILSHLVSVFIFSPIPLAASFVFSAQGQRMKYLLRIAAGMLLGIGLSSFYLISALSHAQYFPVSRLPLWADLEGHLLTAGKLVHGSSNEFIRLVSMSVLEMTAVWIVCSIVVLFKGGSEAKRAVWFWSLVFVVPLFLMHSRAGVVWKAYPQLFAAVQYPWRLNIVLCIAALPIIAMFLSETTRLPESSRALLLVLLVALVSPWVASYGEVWHSYRVEGPRRFSLVNDDDGWFSAWTAPGTDEASALQASMGPQVKFLVGEGIANVLLWKPRQIEIQTNSSTGGAVMVNQFYYAPWRAVSVADSRPINLEGAMPEGLLKVNVPSGTQRVRLELPVTISEKTGQWISCLCILLSAMLMWTTRRDEGRHRAVLSSCEIAGPTCSFVRH